MTLYQAQLSPLNEGKIGTATHGQVTFNLTADSLIVDMEVFDSPANIRHWEHFHGFPDGRQAELPNMAQDSNGDGWIDLVETEAVSGATMVPLDEEPQKLAIAHDHYPLADAKGYYRYHKEIPLLPLQENFQQAFGTYDLDLDKRVVYIHGIPKDIPLPDTVAGKINDQYDQHVTLPIAAGVIKKVSQ